MFVFLVFLGRLTLVEKALSFTHEPPLSFLSIHRAQQPRSGWAIECISEVRS